MRSVQVEAGYKFWDSQTVTVGGTKVALPAPTAVSGIKTPERIQVQALAANTGKIYLAKSTTVAGDGSAGGLELAAGVIAVLSCHDYANINAIASGAGQKLVVNYFAVLT